MFFLIFASFLLMVFGHANGEKCNMEEFRKCSKAIGFESGFFFEGINSTQEFKDNCLDVIEAVKCTKKFAPLCMSSIEHATFMAIQKGVLDTVVDLCTEGTDLYEAYLKNMDCLKKMENDIEFCNKMYVQSQKALTVDTSLDMGQRHFHGCCGYDWLKGCMKRSAEVRCDDDVESYMEEVLNKQHGVAKTLCSAAIFSQANQNCYELYGVDVGQPDELFSSGSLLSASIVVPFLSLLFI